MTYGSGIRVYAFGFRDQGFVLIISASGLRFEGFVIRLSGFVLRVSGSGFCEGFGVRFSAPARLQRLLGAAQRLLRAAALQRNHRLAAQADALPQAVADLARQRDALLQLGVRLEGRAQAGCIQGLFRV